MANRERGEVELKARDATYVLRFGWNEIAEVETLLDVSFFEALAPKFYNPSSIRAAEWRAMLWAALQSSHKNVDLLAAGEIMNVVGMEAIGNALGQAFERSFPTPEAVDGNPQKASPSAGTM